MAVIKDKETLKNYLKAKCKERIDAKVVNEFDLNIALNRQLINDSSEWN